MINRTLRIIAATLCAAAVSSACIAQTAPAKLVVPPIKFEKYTLPNGLEVILSEDHTVPVVAVNVWYHVGPQNERKGLTGFAHLFEHMMFEGSADVPARAHIKYVEAAGGEMNGSTNFDRTNYFETLPSNQIALGLWLESDRMGFLLDTLDREKLTNQRDVVRNERRQSTEGQPYGLSNEEVYHQLFPADHPYYASVIGSHADIESARLNDVRDFFKTYYAPSNATLAIVGDFKPAEAKAMVEKYFGPLQKGKAFPKPTKMALPLTAEKRVTVTDTVQLPAVTLAWLTPSVLAPGDDELDFAQSILGSGKSSRLYQELVYKQQIAQSASCDHDSEHLGSVFSCDFIAKPGTKIEDLEAAAEKIIADFVANGPTPEEMKRALARMEAGAIRPLERVGSVADVLQRYNQETGDPGYLPKQIANLEAIKAADVTKYAQKYLTPTSRVVVTTIPGEKKVNDVPRSPEDTDKDVVITKEYTPEFYAAQAFRKSAPPAGPAPKIVLPVPTSFTLPNGLQVLVAERHKLPIFSAALQARAGSSTDSPSKPGVSGFTASLLTEGTTTRSSTQIANASADIGAALGAGTAVETGSVSLSALSNNPAPALDLFSDVALHPAFDPKEVDRVKKRRLTALLQSQDQPMATAQRVGLRALFGADSPLAYTASGTVDSTKATTADDLSAFYKAHYGPKNAVLVLAGDLTVAQAKEWATKYFGGWSNDVAPVAPVKSSQTITRKIILVDKPGAPQTAMLVIAPGVSRSTPDYAAIEVLNPAIGGLFSSRLNLNLREAHGYTYGAFSQFDFYRGTGMFLAGSSIRTDVTAPAVKETVGELTRIQTDPLSTDELTMSKDSNIRGLPGDFQTTGATAGALANLWVYSLPLDYYAKLPAEYESVTSGQTKAAAAAHIHADQLLIVTVGDKAKIGDSLKALDLGPVEEWTPDGTPKK